MKWKRNSDKFFGDDDSNNDTENLVTDNKTEVSMDT